MSIKALNKIVNSGIKLTPMMDQYYRIKQDYPDTLLLYRMGDFYELFFDDAVEASKILNITLTHRGKLGETPIPMAGIPHHAANNYIDRITALGLKTAICEQIEDPAMAKGIVKRAVTQVVSPAMPYDLEKANGNEHHYIASSCESEKGYYLSIFDFTTGDFWGERFDTSEALLEKLQILDPREFVAKVGQWDHNPPMKKYLESLVTTYLGEDYFQQRNTKTQIERLIPSYDRDEIIKLDPNVLDAVGALAYYVCTTQACEKFVHIKPFKMVSHSQGMKVTLPTLVGLEILPKSRDRYKESLLGFFDKTKTAMGARRLKEIFSQPLRDLESITERQNTVEFFLNDKNLMRSQREKLSEVRDIERILAKISTGKVNAGDLLSLARAVRIYQESEQELNGMPRKVIAKLDRIEQLQEIGSTIERTINDEIGASLDKGNLIRPGADKSRDRLATLSQNAAQELLTLEKSYRQETGISKLKVKSNNVAGFFIEVSKSQLDKIPDYFRRRQTLVNSERFTTDELQNFEKEVILAKEKLEKLEREIFKGIVDSISSASNLFITLASIIANLDSFISFAWIAFQEGLQKPNLNKKKQVLNVKGAWHPLIKSIIKERFVRHDLHLDKECFFGLITGPNMAGKTTVMRELAIIQHLAQLGSFVPAKSANLGLCDYLFSRLGASDDILKGQSTFMVEMAETSEIIRHATSSSLIILDEVGRGTSTYDGLSIAWALVEHFINKTKALTLFSTHYHELIKVIDQSPKAKNLTVETQVQNDDVLFLYRLLETSTGQSYGIYVAKLAGLPNSILSRANNILKGLEKNVDESPKEQLSLSLDVTPTIIEDEIKNLDLSKMTPLESLMKLDELQKTLQ